MRIILSILFLAMCYPTVITVPEDYSTIQESIDASSTGDTVLISSDIYYESIDFLSKNITVAGKYINSGVPADIMQTVIYNVSTLPTVTFGDAGQNNDASLIGISIYSENTGIQLNSTNATIERCLLYNPLHGSGILCNSSSPNIINCTIAGFDNAIFSDGSSNPDINSSILWSESSGIVGSGNVKYSCIRDAFNCVFTDLGGNIYSYPLFDIPGGSPFFGVAGPGLNWRNREYPWIGYPMGPYDGKDNNPWNNANESSLIYGINNDGNEVRIGNGEAMDTGDPDGDGVMGEDWYNGYDDDGDGLVDEDYFYADGIDNGGIPCTEDSNEDGCFCCTGDYGVDENIDGIYDLRFDGVDNDKNGTIDDDDEFYWGANIDNNILIHDGRRNPLLPNGDANPYYIENNPSNNWDVMGDYKYDEELDSLFFDVYIYDFGDDGLPGDPFIDKPGDGEFQLGEPLYLGMFNAFLSDCGLDGICEYLTMPYDLDNDGYFEIGELNPDWPGPDADGTEGNGIWEPGDGWIDNGDGIVDWYTDSYICPCGVIDGSCTPYSDECDYGDDVWPPKNGKWDEGELIFDWGHDGLENTGDPGEHDGELAKDGFMGDPFTDLNGNGIYNYGETYSDLNNNGSYDLPTGEFDGIFDTGDGLFGFEGEPFTDDNGNAIKDPNETFTDTNNDGLYNAPDYLNNWVNMPNGGIIGFTYGASDGFDNDGDGVIDNYEENASFPMTAFRYLFLLESSPAIDAGDPGLSNDLDGSITDIGALTEHFIYGCTNLACDYDLNANVDDGSCECGVSLEYADGVDNDGDWEEWAEEFGWMDDKNDDCPDGAGTIDSCWADPGEWGIVMLEAGVRNGVAYDAGQIFHPYEILYEHNGFPALKFEGFPALGAGGYISVGVDEYHGAYGIRVWPVTDISITIGDSLNMESFTDNNENGIWDDAYWTASSGTMPTESFIDTDGDGIWDRGGYDVIISWEEPPYVSPGFYSEDGNTYYDMGALDGPNYDILTYDVFGYSDEMSSENLGIETSMLVESNIGSNQYICYYILFPPTLLGSEYVNNETCIVTPGVDDDGICDDVDDCVIEDGASQECGCNTGIAEGACDCDGNVDLGCGCGEAGPSGCDETCGSTLELDECGVCGGGGVDADDDGVCDDIDDCVSTGAEHLVYDVDGNEVAPFLGGYDECGVCGGDGPIDGFDCDGESLSLFNGLIPEDFSIHSIYPNPFNPVTNIIYGLPEHVNVQIMVYNLSGKQIEALINQFQTPGYHSVNWNASSYPSGVYLIRMDSGDFTQTQKVVLVK